MIVINSTDTLEDAEKRKVRFLNQPRNKDLSPTDVIIEPYIADTAFGKRTFYNIKAPRW